MRLTRGPGVFTTPENASADCNWTRAALPLPCHTRLFDGPWMSERGRFLPTAPIAIEPLTPLSPLPLARGFGVPSHSFSFARSSFAFPREEAAKVAVATPS